MRFLKTAALAAGLALAASLSATEKLADGLYAEFATPRGAVLAELDYKQAPLMCANFTGLAEGTLAPQNGKPFYTGLTFYRVVPGFVIQSGNPGLKDTDDDPVAHPHRFSDEFVPGLHHAGPGILSMANAGPDTNSCEFFLTLAATQRLNYLHSVFGRVIRGLDVLQQIQQGDAFTIKILRVGAEARAFKNDAAAFKALAAAAKPYAGTKEPGPNAPFDDPDHLLPQDVPRAKNFNFKLANFERVTGIRIAARTFAKAPSEEEDKVPGAYMKALAEKLGTAQHGAVAAYFAADDDWRIWFSEEAAARFLGHAPTAADLAAEGPLHQVKTAFMDAAIAEGNATFERQKQAAPPDKQPPPAQRLKLQADAMLDGLILHLEPK
jgi:cyclophilin family peptidyl-prolyl cis-trans isomerase